ncbi:hypothetical protein NA78x_004391 [Anatilimnocola sp. NA78]|uniref:hypothetical protein n=1 Tax=Anatilimnocola sp. NA78 TaxID=3415683 RepID=UPI003CE5BCCB
MPINVTKFPSKEFAQQFEENCDLVHEYVAFCRDVVRQAKEFAKTQPKAKRKGRKKRPVSYCKLIAKIVEESEVSPAFAYTAKQIGSELSSKIVEWILDKCKEVGLQPSRDLLIQLMRAPKSERLEFAAEMIERKLSTRKITQERTKRFGRKCKGMKRARPPKTLHEAKERIRLEKGRLETVFDTLLKVRECAICPPDGIKYRVPDKIAAQVRRCMKSLTTMQKMLEKHGVEKQAA